MLRSVNPSFEILQYKRGFKLGSPNIITYKSLVDKESSEGKLRGSYVTKPTK